MSKLAIKYDECQEANEAIQRVSTVDYNSLIYDLEDVICAIDGLTYKPSTSVLTSTQNKCKDIQEKLDKFSNGLGEYIQKLYDFDNSFYSNFDNLQQMKSKINIADLLLTNGNLLYVLRKEFFDLSEAKKQLRDFLLDPQNFRAASNVLKWQGFKIVSDGKNKYITLTLKNFNETDPKEIAKYLQDKFEIFSDKEMDAIFKGTNKDLSNKLKNFADRLVHDKVKIYDITNKKLSLYGNKLKDSSFFDLDNYLDLSKIKLSSGGKIASDVWDSMKNDVFGEVSYIKDDLKGFLKEAKTGKVAASSAMDFMGNAIGVVDKTITIVDNSENLRDENGKWDLDDPHKWANMVSDTTIDLGSGAVAAGVGTLAGAGAAAATGAMIGSVVPGVGTIVGAGVGAFVNVAINDFKWGDPPSSCVDKLKDGAKSIINKWFD